MNTCENIGFKKAPKMLFLAVCLSFCQSLSAEIDLGTSTLEEIQQALKNKTPGYDAASFTSAAFKSRRIDVLKLCWETPGTSYYFIPALQNLPESPFKQDMLVMLLKSSSGQWLNGPNGGFAITIQNALAKDFLPMIRKHLPDTPIDFEVIATPERRLKLAQELETVVQRIRSREAESERKN